MTNEGSGLSYEPDPDASALDRAVMMVAKRMSDAGWTEAAEGIAANMAYVREYAGNPHDQTDGTLTGLRDALEAVADSARAIADAIGEAFPDELALRDRA